VPLEFPGLEQNFADGGTNIRPVIYYFDQASPPDCEPFPAFTKPDCSDTAIALCGSAGGPQFNSDFGQTTIALSGVTCDNVGSLPNVLSISAWMCASNTSCRRELEVPNLAFGGPGVALAIGCGGPPPQQSCHPGGGAMCQQCLPGGANVDGSTPTFGDTGGAGPMTPVGLAYTGGGVGAPGQPGSGVSAFPGTSALVASMHAGLGRHWTHAYSERIVPDPDASQVWLLTAAGTFHRFTDGDLDGTYDQVEPTNDYRTLTHDPATGWTLTDLDGTVQSFDTAGLWLSTTDRNGNTTQATYSASGLLERVDLPGRSGVPLRLRRLGAPHDDHRAGHRRHHHPNLDHHLDQRRSHPHRPPGRHRPRIHLRRRPLAGLPHPRRARRHRRRPAGPPRLPVRRPAKRVTRTWRGDVSPTGPTRSTSTSSAIPAAPRRRSPTLSASPPPGPTTAPPAAPPASPRSPATARCAAPAPTPSSPTGTSTTRCG
jgi:YD repeat-containing protein